MTARTPTITELPPSPAQQRRERTIRYTTAMAIRVICVVLVLLVPDWWRLAPAIAAIVLPYVAVVLANGAARLTASTVRRPGALSQGAASDA